MTSRDDAVERAERFHEEYDHDIDAGATLAEIVISLGDYLARIVGREDADAAMAEIARRLHQAAYDQITLDDTDKSDWRDTLQSHVAHCFSYWPMGARLHDLAAYAYYGITLHGGTDPAELARHIEELVKEATDFLAATPVEQWGIDREQRSQLSRLILLARNRWALDNGQSVEPAALADFGGVSEGRIRNLMSDPKSALPSQGGRVPAQQALTWLAGRKEFRTSLWREQHLPQYSTPHRPPLQQAVFLPVARDDRPFHPGLRRGAGYTIGAKGSETQIAEFDVALAELQRMPAPFWRRPNKEGNWGIVKGVRWVRVDAADLAVLEANPGHTIPRDEIA